MTSVEAVCDVHDTVMKTSAQPSESSSPLPLLARLIQDAGMSVVGAIEKGTYYVVFVRHPDSAFSYAVKLFPVTWKGTTDFKKESARHELIGESEYVAKAIECVDFSSGTVPPITLGAKGSLQKKYSYIMMPQHKNGSLLALLMRANHNNN
jgi:hypothetical protein